MSINSLSINAGAINGADQRLDEYPISFGLSQDVILHEEYLLSAVVGQSVEGVFSISSGIQQAVVNVLPVTSAIEWELFVYLDDVIQPNITDSWFVEHEENGASIAEFVLKPDPGALDLQDWVGAAVKIDYRDSRGVFRRIFTGVVDLPSFDVSEGVVVFECTNGRKDVISSKTKDQIRRDIGGYWSKYVFDEEATTYEYAIDRLNTAVGTYDTDEFNTLGFTPFLSKSVADIVYSESEIVDGSLIPQLVSRDDLQNQSTIEANFRFTRLRHRERTYKWSLFDSIHGSPFRNWAEHMRDPVSFLPQAAVRAAIDSMPWLLKGDITFQGLPAAGYYGGWGWTPKSSVVKWDSDGRQIRTVRDITNVYATQADFTLARRFSQVINEKYTVTLTAPQSVAAHQAIDGSASVGVEAVYDPAEWEAATEYTAPTGTLTPNGDFVIDQESTADGSRAEFDNAYQTIEAIERRKILASHRDNTVSFQVLLDPSVNLRKTIEVSTAALNARGKVSAIRHSGNISGEEPFALTDISIRISKATGAAPTDPGNNAPAQPGEKDQSYTPGTKLLKNHFGNHTDSPVYDEAWSGYVANYKYSDLIGETLTKYGHAFIIDGEKVIQNDRQARDIESRSTVEIEIPDELLSITVQ